MQKCTVVGNVGSIQIYNGQEFEKVESITGGEKGTKVFLSIGDHYYSSKEKEMKTRYISVQGYLPNKLRINTGMLLGVDFVINPYKNSKGEWREAKDIINWDVSLRSANKGSGTNSQDNSDASANVPETDNEGFMNIPDNIDEELPFN